MLHYNHTIIIIHNTKYITMVYISHSRWYYVYYVLIKVLYHLHRCMGGMLYPAVSVDE